MSDELSYKKRPCNECPFRVDVPIGRFPTQRFEELRRTAGRPGQEAPLTASVFACHKTEEGKEAACAGWLAVCGGYHLGIRFAVIEGRLPGSVLSPGEDWPELYPTYEAMSDAQYAWTVAESYSCNVPDEREDG